MKPPKRMSAADVLLIAKANGFNYLKATDCPDLTTRHARGFPKDFNLNTGRSKTHRQERCPTCGFYALWTERIDGEPDA